MDGGTIAAIIAAVVAVVEAVVLGVWTVRGKIDGNDRDGDADHRQLMSAMEGRIVSRIEALKTDVDKDIEVTARRIDALERRNDEVHEKLWTALGRVTEQQASTSAVLAIYQQGQLALQRAVHDK